MWVNVCVRELYECVRVCEMVCVCVYAYMCVSSICVWVCVCVSVCQCVCLSICPPCAWVLGWTCIIRFGDIIFAHWAISPAPISMSSSILLSKCPHYLLNKFPFAIPSLPQMLPWNQERCSGMAIHAWLPGPLLSVSFALTLRLSALGSKAFNSFYLYFRCTSTRMAVSRSSWVTLVWPPLLMAPCTQSAAPQHMWLLKSLQRLGECSPWL